MLFFEEMVGCGMSNRKKMQSEEKIIMRKDTCQSEHLESEIEKCIALFDAPIEYSFMQELKTAREKLGVYLSLYWSFWDYARGVFPTKLACWSIKPYLSDQVESNIAPRSYRSVITVQNGRPIVNPKIVEACRMEGLSVKAENFYTLKVEPCWRSHDALSSMEWGVMPQVRYNNTMADNKFVIEALQMLRKTELKSVFLVLEKVSTDEGYSKSIPRWRLGDFEGPMCSTINLQDYQEIMAKLVAEDVWAEQSSLVALSRNVGITVHAVGYRTIEVSRR